MKNTIGRRMLKKGNALRMSCMFAILFCIVFFGSKAYAADVVISDSGNFFSTEELTVVEQNISYLIERYDITVHLITSNKIGKNDHYKEYVQKQRNRIDNKNVILVLMGAKKKQEICFIKAYGSATKNLNRKRLKTIEENVEKQLENQDYMEASDILFGSLLEKVATKSVFDLFIFHPLFHAFLSFAIVIGVLFLLLHRFDKTKIEKVPYLNEKYSIMIGKIDHFSHISAKPLKRKKSKHQNSD